MDYLDATQKEQEERISLIKRKLNGSFLSKNGLNPAEILMLYYARKYTNDQEDFPLFWKYQYAVDDPKQILNKLCLNGFIRTASAEESIGFYKVAELKSMLKEQGAKTTGTKQELISRLFETSSVDYLDSKITKRSFALTELGETELEENSYVPYFGQKEEIYGISIWDMNKYLHEHPKAKYRDVIWGQLNKELYNSASEIKYSNYHQYCRVKELMAKFLLEEKNRQKEALMALAESIYYRVNIHLFTEYTKRLESYKYLEELEARGIINGDHEKPSIYMCLSQIISPYYIGEMLKQIKNELDFSNNDLFQALIQEFARFNAPAPILSNVDLAGLVVASVDNDRQNVDRVCANLESEYASINRVAESRPIPQKSPIQQNSAPQQQVERKLSFLSKLFGAKK